MRDKKNRPLVKRLKLPSTRQAIVDAVIVACLTIGAVYLKLWWVFG